ncbi:MAG: T9SS type A sorting domain-containing protein [Bacteroidetes bacterium]|nr:T9SS type A sorting domain-containing protein [Bacteroidota bacterium]
MKNPVRPFSYFLLLMLSHFAEGQIVYTDITPDQQFALGTYYLDLNNDSTTDFTISLTSVPVSGLCGLAFNSYLKINALNGNKFFGEPLNQNDSINGNISWSDLTTQTLLSKTYACIGHLYPMWHISYSGSWNGEVAADGNFLPLKLISGNEKFYGWIKIIADSYVSAFTVTDYAVNSVSNQSILAGQTCLPQAAIIANGPTTFCAGDSVVLSSANSGSNLTYKWKLNGSNISGATGKTYTAKVAGRYKVNVKDNTNNCSVTSALVKVKVPCKVLNQDIATEANSELNVYPNPVSQLSVVSFQLPQDENVSLKIFDVQGRLIRTLANEVMSEGTHTLTWDARDENGSVVSEGIYFLRMQTESEVKTIAVSVVK